MSTRRAVWLLVAVSVAVYLYRTVFIVWPFLFQTPGDFGYYRQAAAAILDGATPFAHSFDYPPLFPLLVTPLARLPLGTARIAWYLLSQGCLIGAAACLVKPLGGDPAALAAVAAVWAAGGTLPENLVLGQVNPLMLLLVALAWRWDAERPGRAAGAIGLAAGIKVWPGLLLAAYLGRERRRALGIGLAVAAAAVVLPWLLLTALTAPPHLPASGEYWMGTPAPLNLSLPAAALRGTYPPRKMGEDPLPGDWLAGNNPAELHLTPWRRRLSVWVALLALAAGLFALALRGGWDRAEPRDRLFVLAALTALATFASPISWYHYQLFALPGLALLAATALRRRALLPLAGAAILLAGLTHTELIRRLAGGPEERAILLVGIAVPLLAAALFAALVAGIGRARIPEAAAAGDAPGDARTAEAVP
jgi:alpha-1,2-mannosyltransferase